MKNLILPAFTLLMLACISFILPYFAPAWFTQGVIIFFLIIAIILVVSLFHINIKNHE